jgi:HlyD family secretion protein
MAKGSGDNLKIARFELENARLKFLELQRQINQATVRSPTTGTILLAELSGDKEKKGKELGVGVSVTQGEMLVSIGDLDVLCVKTMVDEMSVLSIRKGQKVRITGEAFPDTMLEGEVHHVSSQAAKGDGGRGEMPSFEVTTVINKLKPEERKSILLGMSTNLSILFYEKPGAITVPVAAVKMDKDGAFAEVLQGQEKKKVKVQPGITTLDAVEVKAGLKAGDVVVY